MKPVLSFAHSSIFSLLTASCKWDLQPISKGRIVSSAYFLKRIHTQFTIYRLGMKALAMTGTKCLHFSPCCSRKVLCVDKFAETCQTSQTRKRLWVLFSPDSLSLARAPSPNSSVRTLQRQLEIALFSLLFFFFPKKAVLFVSGTSQTSSRASAEDFCGIAEESRTWWDEAERVSQIEWMEA